MQENYKGYLIYGLAMLVHTNSREWYSQGEVCMLTPRNSLIEVKRISGLIFGTEEEAKQHGLKLCKTWIDQRRPNLKSKGGR